MNILEIGSTTQLFLDDFIIEDVFAAERKFAVLEKEKANPFLRGEYEWELTHGPEIYGTVMYDEQYSKFRIWYTIPKDLGPEYTASYDEQYRQYVKVAYYICYAESTDGRQWVKPMLGLHELMGSKQNNIVMRGKRVASGPSVIINPDTSNPSKRYIMSYQDDGVCIAFSPDGLHWTLHPENPVIEGLQDTQVCLAWDEKQSQWLVYLRPNVFAAHWKRRVALSVSKDLVNWSDPEMVYIPENSSYEVYGLPVFRYGEYFLGFSHDFYSTSSSTQDIGLLFSRDGIHWQKAVNSFIELGPIGDFDSYGIYTGNTVIPDGDRLRIYYTGKNARHNDVLEKKTSSIGYGTIRHDGFCCLDGTNAKVIATAVQGARLEDGHDLSEEAVMITRPFLFEGQNIKINAWAPRGYVKVEIIDPTKPVEHKNPGPAHEKVYPGLSLEECIPFQGNSTAHTLNWRNKQSLSQLRGKPVRLKFVFRGARLYSFTVMD